MSKRGAGLAFELEMAAKAVELELAAARAGVTERECDLRWFRPVGCRALHAYDLKQAFHRTRGGSLVVAPLCASQRKISKLYTARRLSQPLKRLQSARRVPGEKLCHGVCHLVALFLGAVDA